MKRISIICMMVFGFIMSLASISFASDFGWSSMPTHGRYVSFEFAKNSIQNYKDTNWIEVASVGKLKGADQSRLKKALKLKKTPVYMLQIIVFDYANERYASRVTAFFDSKSRIIFGDESFSPWYSFSDSDLIVDLATRVAQIASSM